MGDFERRLCGQLSNYTSLKHFICLKSILKDFSAILHSQSNYAHALAVTPFKEFFLHVIKVCVCPFCYVIWMLSNYKY